MSSALKPKRIDSEEEEEEEGIVYIEVKKQADIKAILRAEQQQQSTQKPELPTTAVETAGESSPSTAGNNPKQKERRFIKDDRET